MKIHSTSGFADPTAGRAFIEQWNAKVIAASGLKVTGQVVASLLGNTQVWTIGAPSPTLPPMVIFPGFRTCALFWLLDSMIAPIAKERQVILIDTNGQPSLSEGNTPDIKGKGYGVWATHLLTKLGVHKAVVMGASFGALVCLKLGAEGASMVKQAFLLNPGCLAPFSLSPKNLYLNLLPIISPKPANVRKFLSKAVFHAPEHKISASAMELLVEYEVYVLKNWKDKAQKPYAMKDAELKQVNVKAHLLVGEMDPLFPHQKSMKRAKLLPKLDHVHVLPGTAHGIELSHAAMDLVVGVLEG